MLVSRRNFLKAMGTAGAVASLGLAMDLPAVQALAKGTEAAGETKTTFGYCRMCMKDDCGTLVTTTNGVVTDVSGNPKCTTNKGTLCPRGRSAIMNMYNPYRVKAPMKRTNPKKGMDVDPGWVEISWDEAIETVGNKLRDVRKKDPRQLVYNTGFAMMDYFVTFGPLFAFAYGTPNWLQSNGPLCAVHYATEMIQGCFPVAIADYKYGNYVISVGRTGGANFAVANGSSKALADALERGMKIINVDPRCSMEGSKGEWVPIIPAGDLSFLLGMMNVMLFEIKKLDFNFLKNRSNAPYLVKDDGDYVRGANGKPMMWDLGSGSAKEFDQSISDPAIEGSYEVNGVKVRPSFELVKEGVKEYTAEWAEKKSTVPAATIRRIASEFVEHAMIGATIKIGNTVFPFRPACIVASRGSMNHVDGAYVDLVAKLINELVGNLDVPGGVQGCNYGPKLAPNADGVVAPAREAVGECEFTYPPNHYDLAEYFPYRHSMPYMAYRTMANPEKYGIQYKPEVLLVAGGNSINGSVEPDMIAESVMKVPFVATVCYHIDEVAQLSDILMPEHSMLERLSVNTNGGPLLSLNNENMGVVDTVYREPVPAIYNTRQPHDIMIDLLERSGALGDINMILNDACMLGEVTMAKMKPQYRLDPTKKYSIEEIWDRGLKSLYGDEFGMDYLKKNGIIEKRYSEEESYNYFYFPDSKTRYQLYVWEHLNNGRKVLNGIKKFNAPFLGLSEEEIKFNFRAVPAWTETPVMKPSKEFNLFAFNYKQTTSMFRMGTADQNPWLVDWSQDHDPFYNVITLNPDTAASLGLKSGDMVKVESVYGQTQGKLYLTQTVHPQAAGIGGAMGRKTMTLGKKAASRIHYNALMGAPIGTFDIIDGGTENTVRVKVYKA